MKRIVESTYEAISKKAAEDLVAKMKAGKSRLVCVASGDTPAGMYRQLAAMVAAHTADIPDWYFVGLDEWAGMNESDEGSCRWHLDRQLFQPLNVPDNRICFFNGRARNLEEECSKTEAFIQQHGGIEVAVVGLGLNGHIGMNEPGTAPGIRTHVADIDEETQRVGQKYFSRPVTISKGLTLGLANLMETRQLMIMATGAHKASIVQKIINTTPTEKIPATLFRNHHGLALYLDEAAAKPVQAS